MMVVLAIGSKAFRARLDGAPTAAFSGFGTVLPAAASRQVSPPLAGAYSHREWQSLIVGPDRSPKPPGIMLARHDRRRRIQPGFATDGSARPLTRLVAQPRDLSRFTSALTDRMMGK